MRRLVCLASVLILSLTGAAGGEDTLTLAAGWRFQPDPDHAGVDQGWHTPDFDDSGWATVDAGQRWEDQGFPEVDGYAWYRKTVTPPADWADREVWFFAGAVNDAATLYLNGERVAAFGAPEGEGMHRTPVVARLTGRLRAGEENVLAVECYDFGASGGLWRLPCILTTAPEQLPLEQVAACYGEYATGRIVHQTNLRILGNDLPRIALTIRFLKPAAEKPLLDERTYRLKPDAQNTVLYFMAPKPEAGDVFRFETRLETVKGEPVLGAVAVNEVVWPEAPKWPGSYARFPVRNNFVTELYADVYEAETQRAHFVTPRTGWVYLRAVPDVADPAGAPPEARIDGERDAFTWRKHGTAFEAMRKLARGPHQMEITFAERTRLEMRAVPELAFCYYPATPHITAFGPYDWDFMGRHVLPHVNTLITHGQMAEPEKSQWLNEGRQWLFNAALPGLGEAEAPEAKAVFETWHASPGVQEPEYAGLIVDELLWASPGHYQAWGDALGMLHVAPEFQGKQFYMWTGGDPFLLPASTAFCQKLFQYGYRAAPEKYLPEAPTLQKAEQALNRELRESLRAWATEFPGALEQMSLCLGYLCAPPETLNRDPGVDYHVWMDMQFHLLATQPQFFGLGGLFEYSASYADEESLIWAHRLMRHYCIEGSRRRVTFDPYLLPHLENPDFAQGLDGWSVRAAENGSVRADNYEGFSWLQGRYPRTDQGDRFCVMRRAEDGPNTVVQTLRELEPGRPYSLKVIAADLEHWNKEQLLGLHIEVEGVERIEPLCFQTAYHSNYAHELGPYDRENPAWFNLFRVVFRPEGDTAVLRISDWAGPDTPGAGMGQEIAFNFVEVQPYRAPVE